MARFSGARVAIKYRDRDFSSLTALDAIEIVKPKLLVNGHMHSGGCRIYACNFMIKYIYYIDRSPPNRHYIVFNKLGEIEIWKNKDYVIAIKL